MSAKITAPKVRARKGGAPIKMITAYDYPTALIAHRAGADIILVGDSVANVVLGYGDTLAVSVDDRDRSAHTPSLQLGSGDFDDSGRLGVGEWHHSTSEMATGQRWRAERIAASMTRCVAYASAKSGRTVTGSAPPSTLTMSAAWLVNVCS